MGFREHGVAFDFFKKRAGTATHGGAEFRAVPAMGDGEGFHRASDSHIKKPPFLVHSSLRFRALMGEESILRSNEENMGKLKALGGMERDECKTGGVVLLVLLALAVQGKFVEEILHAAALFWFGGWPGR